MIKTQYLSTTEDELVACPAGKQQAVTTIVFCNVDTTASKTFTLYAVPNGGTKVELLVGNTLDAGRSFSFDNERLILGPGDAIVTGKQ